MKSQNEQIKDILDGSINEIKHHPRVGRGVPIIVAIEACSSDAIWIAPILMAHPDVLVMSEFKKEFRYGVPKNNEILIGLVGTTHAFLSRKLVSFTSDFVSYSTHHAAKRTTLNENRDDIMNQFENFRVDSASGKVHGKGGGKNDDIIIAFMMALYWMTKFAMSEKEVYWEFRARYESTIWMDTLAPLIATIPIAEKRNEYFQQQRQNMRMVM